MRERVFVQPPPVGRHDPQPASCFAVMHPLHGESFTRYFSNVETYRRLRDHHFTGTYRAFEVATKDPNENVWVASQQDTWYGGLWRREKRFLAQQEQHRENT
ncbi:MAG TPA: hypothetical protein VNG51_22075 [Ktedonobacteraceae bacterium]|nr:hypothetical protein [Ktedonobacteraceae bacterium]